MKASTHATTTPLSIATADESRRLTPSSAPFRKQVLASRLMCLALIAAAFTSTSSLNHLIDRAWDACRQTWLWKHDSFEPFVVVVTFIFTLLAWAFLENHMEFMRVYKIRPHKDTRWFVSDVQLEIGLYILPLLIFDFFYPRRRLPILAPTFPRLCLEVLGCLIVYDGLFFLVHTALHKFPALYRYSHARHHEANPCLAFDTIKLTASEQIMDVSCSIAAVNVFGAHPLSRAIYNVVVIILLCELHCGYDMPWMLQNIVPFELWGGSRRHDKHHEIGNVYFQKFFTYLDDGFGFVEKAKKRGHSNSNDS